jgi:hypothetical protein
MLKEIARSGHATRQHNQIGISVIALLKLDICLDIYTVGRFYQWELRRAHCYNFYAATTQHVNRDESLDILEAVSQEYINFCHILFVVLWKLIIFAAQRCFFRFYSAKIAKSFETTNNQRKK